MLPAYLVFIYYFTGRTKYIKLKSFLWYLGGGVISILALTTPYFVKSIHPEYSYIRETPGLLEPLGRFYIIFGIVIGLTYLLREYFKSEGFPKLQIKYFILGILIYTTGGIVFTGILPLIEREAQYFDLTAFFSIFFVGLTSYAILRYRLLDLRFVLGRTAVYILSSLTLVAISFLIMFFNIQLGSLFSTNVVLIIALIIIALSFLPLFRFLERIAGKYFYYTYYTLQTTLADLSRKLNQTIELSKLTTLINRSLLDALNLDKVGIVLKKPKEKTLYPQALIKFREEDISSILTQEQGFLPQYLQKTKEPLVSEEIPFIIEKTEAKEEKLRLSSLKESMEKSQIATLLPLLVEEELIGIIVLGNKLSQEAYTVQDLDLLTILTAQASIAFNNALSYSEIEKRKADLEKFYKLTVGRELKMIELKKEIEKLKKEQPEKS